MIWTIDEICLLFFTSDTIFKVVNETSGDLGKLKLLSIGTNVLVTPGETKKLPALGLCKILWQAIPSNVKTAPTSYQLLLILLCCSMWSRWCIISICLTNVLVRKTPQAIIDNNDQGIYFRVCSTLQQLCTPRCYVVFCCGLTQLGFTFFL